MSRSYLFVPADSERKLDKARDAGADALIVDLEDSVLPDRRADARELLKTFLADGARVPVWVRINPIDSQDAMLDLRAAVPGEPAGIVLPKCAGADDLRGLVEVLNELESEHGLPVGRASILPLVTELPAALFRVQEYAGVTDRLYGLTWGAEDLSTTVGATATRDADGRWLPAFEFARSLCLLGAANAGVRAVDTVFTNFRDEDGLRRQARDARRDGFTGMLAIHPAQVGIINEAFTPSAEEVERAERIVALFHDNPEAGTLALDGEMLDRPHLEAAKRLLSLAGSDAGD